MGDYFKPLRRKVGVVTLVMACLFMAIWLEGQGGSRPLLAIYWNRYYKTQVQSFDGHIQLISLHTNPVAAGYVKVHAVVPCWPMISSLTLLSAWLLFSKPRSKPAKAQSFSVDSPHP